MSLSLAHFSRPQRDAFEAVRRVTSSPLDSIRLREAIIDRLAVAVPFDAGAMATADPEFGLFTHGSVWRYPDTLLKRFYREIYANEAAIKFIDMAREGRGVSRDVGPIEAEANREHGLGPKLNAAFGEHGRLWGALCLARGDDQAPFSDSECALVGALVPLITSAFRRAALLEQSEYEIDAPTDAPSIAPGVAIYNTGGTLVLRDARASQYLDDLKDINLTSEMPVPVAGALTQLRWRLRSPERYTSQSADVGVRMRGRSGRWYSVHASATESNATQNDGHSVVVFTPLGGGERANVLAQLYGLTTREREVIARIAHGESGKQIAANLGLSAHTVQAHIDNACEKMGVRGRRELVAKLFVDASASRVMN